jgi:hypothetical protein
MRGAYRRPWLKLWAIECLEGSIRWQLSAEERGTWYDLLALARICGQEGTIGDRDDRAFPHVFIANRLNIPLELLERTLKKCEEEGRLTEDDKGILITNWKVYQSEYERQKKYRVKPEGEDDKDKFRKQKHGDLVRR